MYKKTVIFRKKIVNDFLVIKEINEIVKHFLGEKNYFSASSYVKKIKDCRCLSIDIDFHFEFKSNSPSHMSYIHRYIDIDINML